MTNNPTYKKNSSVKLPACPRSAIVFNNRNIPEALRNVHKTGATLLYQEGEYEHKSIKELMNEASMIHAQALLIDVISHPRHQADISINDMNGYSCSPYITAATAEVFRSYGLTTAFNKPTDQTVIRTAVDQSKGHHTLQIDIALDLWKDDKLEIDWQKAYRLNPVFVALSSKLAKLMVA